MRRWALLALWVLAACGGGGGGGEVTNEVVTVHVVASLADGAVGYTSWDAKGHTEIYLLDSLDAAQRLLILKHELWHALVHRADHPNDSDCVSSHDLANLPAPCDEEVAQVNAAGRKVHLWFEGDYGTAEAAALWWDNGCGRDAVTAVLAAP